LTTLSLKREINLSEQLKPYFQDKDVTIYHADCRDILPELPKVDLVLTDPPYGEGQAFWDNEKPQSEIWDSLYLSLKEGGVLYYHGFWGHADWVLTNAKRVGFTPLSRLVWWFKTGRPETYSYREDTEEIWYFSKGIPNTFNSNSFLEPYEDDTNYSRYGRNGKHPGTVLIASRIKENYPENVGHPTQKPLVIIERLVGISSNVDDLILDPFMGSGTTLRAAKNLGRKAIGIEIEEKYCEIAAKRMSQTVMDLHI